METEDQARLGDVTAWDSIPRAVLVKCFSFLTHRELTQLLTVSRNFSLAAENDGLWKALTRRKPEGESSYFSDLRSPNYKKLYQELACLRLHTYRVVDQQSDLYASSTDHKSQSIANVLRANPSFWSSKGADAEKPETLIFGLVSPVTIVTSVSLKPYRAAYQWGQPIYAPRAMRISLGYTRDEFVWSSDVFPVLNEDREQTFHIAPRIVGGKFLRLELLGRYQTQREDDLYYICLEKIGVKGCPLGVLKEQPYLSRAIAAQALDHGLSKEMSWSTDSMDCKSSSLVNQLLEDLSASCAGFVVTADEHRRKMMRIKRELSTGNFMAAGELVYQEFRHDSHARNQAISWLRRTEDQPFRSSNPRRSLYLYPFLKRGNIRLNHAESFLVGELDHLHPSQNVFFNLLRAGLMSPSEELGDYYVAKGELRKATIVFQRCNVVDRVIEVLIMSKLYSDLVVISREFDIEDIIEKIIKVHSADEALLFAKELCESDVTADILDRVVKKLQIDARGDWNPRRTILAEVARRNPPDDSKLDTENMSECSPFT